MGAVRLRFRSELRDRVRSWIGLAIVVAVVGGAVLALAAGARRTDSAYERFLKRYPASDYTIADSSDFGFTSTVDLEQIRDLPHVADASRVNALIAAGARTGDGRSFPIGILVPFAAEDPAYGRTVERWKVVEGRRADPTRVDEMVVGFELAREYSLDVGSTIEVDFVRRDSFVRLAPGFLGCLADRIGTDPSPSCAKASVTPEPPDLSILFRIVGIEASALEFPPYEGNLNPPVHLTRAFSERHAADLVGSDILLVKLRPDADPVEFLDVVAALNPESTVSVLSVGADHADTVEQSIHLQAVGLGILAALVGLAAAFALGQAFARQAFVAIADDLTALRTLGMTRVQFVTLALARAAVTAGAGIGLAVVVAVALSPIWPVGLAREAEPDRGVSVDPLVLALGSLAVLTLALVVAGVATLRQVRSSGRALPKSRTARVTSRLGLPVPAIVGVGQALEPGRGRAAVPVRSAMVAGALAVTVLVAAMTIGSSTDHLLETRSLFGWSRDTQIGSDGTPPVAEPVVAGMRDLPAIDAIAAGTVTDVEIDGQRISAFALDDVQGEVAMDLVEGRRPRAHDEIVLGITTSDEIDAKVGDRVMVSIGGDHVSTKVVGRGVFSRIGSNGQLGRGAQITFTALRRALPDAPQNVVLADFAPDADPDAVYAHLQNAVSVLPVLEPAPPAELTSFGRVDNLPAILAVILIAVATAILGHTMITTVQRRRRDYAVLEALGFVRRQVGAAVAVQASTFAAVSVVIGIPLGLLAGRWVWDAIAQELGVPSEPTTHAVRVLLVLPGVLLLTNLVALVPAALARRTRPAAELRSE
jgi:hypothetical protein